MLTVEREAGPEYRSGEVVEPGLYEDVESGVMVRVNEPDTLPDGRRMVVVTRRFRRVAGPGASN